MPSPLKTSHDRSSAAGVRAVFGNAESHPSYVPAPSPSCSVCVGTAYSSAFLALVTPAAVQGTFAQPIRLTYRPVCYQQRPCARLCKPPPWALESAGTCFCRCLGMVQVNNIAPTVAWSDMGIKTWGDPAKSRPMLDKTPIGRFVEPWEIANMVVFLSSDACTMCLGQTICVDGGYTCL